MALEWLAALNSYFAQQGVAVGQVNSAEKFSGGQSNPTYLLSTTCGPVVLRRKPAGQLLASAHAIDREFRVLQSLHRANFPVAMPIHYCNDASVIGSEFYLMQHMQGRIFWNPGLPELAAHERGAIYAEIARVLGQLHRLRPADIGLADFAKPGDYFARQLKRWREQYAQSQTEPLSEMDQLIEQLAAALPDANQDVLQSVSLVHGDFRIDNLMFHPSEPKIIAVMDWELSTLGHPLADASYFCMALRLPENPTLPGLGGQDRANLGIPSEAEWLANYQLAAGRADVTQTEFLYAVAFNFFRLAAIAQGVKKRALQGNASNARADQVGQMVGTLAKAGLQTLQSANTVA